jgi:hypothetical protein
MGDVGLIRFSNSDSASKYWLSSGFLPPAEPWEAFLFFTAGVQTASKQAMLNGNRIFI